MKEAHPAESSSTSVQDMKDKSMTHEYCVIWAPTIRDLHINVNLKCKDGWQPCGGLAIDRSSKDYISFYQAMTKCNPIVS